MHFTRAAVLATLATLALAAQTILETSGNDVLTVVRYRAAPSCSAVTDKGIPNCVLDISDVASATECLSNCQADSRCKSFGVWLGYPSGLNCATYAYTIESNPCTSPPFSSTGSLYDVAGCSKYCSGDIDVPAPNCVLQVVGTVSSDADCISQCKSYSGCKSVSTFTQWNQGLTCYLYADLIEEHKCSSPPLSQNANLYDIAGCP